MVDLVQGAMGVVLYVATTVCGCCSTPHKPEAKLHMPKQKLIPLKSSLAGRCGYFYHTYHHAYLEHC